MFHRIAPSALRIAPSALLSGALTAAAAAALAIVPAAASASSSPSAPKPPTPISNTTCWGSLKPAPTAYEPNLLSYQFHCDTPITGYTIVANRRAWDTGVIDDFDTTPVALTYDDVTPDTRTSWLCEGSIPADGFNCNAGAGGSMVAWSFAQGTLDTADPYCGTPAASASTKKKHAKKANPLKPTYPPGLPRAIVQLVVTDSTGAQDGPFVLGDTASCWLKKSAKHVHHA